MFKHTVVFRLGLRPGNGMVLQRRSIAAGGDITGERVLPGRGYNGERALPGRGHYRGEGITGERALPGRGLNRGEGKENVTGERPEPGRGPTTKKTVLFFLSASPLFFLSQAFFLRGRPPSRR